jgi:hypothetical protein
MTRQPFLAAAALILAFAPMSAWAAPIQVAWEQAPAAQGQQVPLPRVLKMLSERYKGKQLNTTMGQAGGRPAYLVQWQLPNGRITVFTVDAQTGQVVGQ